MNERKYEKYIINELRIPEEVQKHQEKYNKVATRILWLEDEMIKGASSVIISWYWKAVEKGGGSPSHVHDFDEVVGLIGSDPQNPKELYGEVEFWLEDEKYILTKSSLIYCPKGLRHCPLRVLKVERPILFLAFSTTLKYKKDGIIEND